MTLCLSVCLCVCVCLSRCSIEVAQLIELSFGMEASFHLSCTALYTNWLAVHRIQQARAEQRQQDYSPTGSRLRDEAKSRM